jgi:hypothetical protein
MSAHPMSIVSSILRFAFQRRLGRAALLCAVAAGVFGGYLLSHGGWANTFHLPPVLDESTPRSQNGFVLLDIQLPGHRQDQYGQAFTGFQYGRVDDRPGDWTAETDTADAFGLWIQPPPLPKSLASPSDIDSQSSVFGKAFSVTARLSTGDLLPLGWHLRDETNWRLPSEKPAKRLLFVILPSGYSGECRSVEFTVADQSGHSAHWLFSRLPQMCHAVPPPPHSTTTVTENGVMMSAQAWHPSPGQPMGEINYLLRPVLPANSHQWDVLVTEQSREWESFGDTGQVPVYAYSGTPIAGRNGVFSTGSERSWGGIYGIAGFDFYPRTTRYLRLGCTLRQFETYTETVTFHNLAVRYDEDEYHAGGAKTYYLEVRQPLIAVTPSGVMVTLPVQGKQFKPTLFMGDLNFLVSTRPEIPEKPTAYALPKSPLSRTFGKPVQISLTFPPPYQASGWSYERGGTAASYALPLPINPAWHPTPAGLSKVPLHADMPPVLKTLTLIVHQRVNLQSIPMTFTLPILDQAPYSPKSYRKPAHL